MAEPTKGKPPPGWVTPAEVTWAEDCDVGIVCLDERAAVLWMSPLERSRVGAPGLVQPAVASYPEAFVAAVSSALQRPTQVEAMILRGESPLHLRWTLRPVTDQGRRYVKGSSVDITGARVAQHLVHGLDATEAIALRLDAELRVVWLNDGAARLFGTTRRDILGRSLATLPSEYVGGEFEQALRTARARGTLLRFERYHSPGERWYENTLLPSGDGLFVFATDVTARRNASDDLVEADRRKDEFLATLAHELRNPLAPIRNATAFLRRIGSAQPEKIRAWNIIDRQVSHLARLVDDLLDVSRFTFGRMVLHRQPTPLARVLSHAVDTAMPGIEAARHRLSVELPPDVLLVDGDFARLAQVFLNLLVNATKYTDPGGEIAVQTQWTDASVSVRVRDSGIGIAPDMQRHVFDLFTQVDRRYDQARGGLGIGLTLARHLTELHDGTIEVRSEGVGRGSVFTVTLPRVAERRASVAPPSENGRRVLLVDSNVEDAERLAAYLELYGHATHVLSPSQARGAFLESARSFQPDLALVDLDAEGATEALKAADLRASLVAIMSGPGPRPTGFVHHMAKPVEPDLVLALIQGTARR